MALSLTYQEIAALKDLSSRRPWFIRAKHRYAAVKALLVVISLTNERDGLDASLTSERDRLTAANKLLNNKLDAAKDTHKRDLQDLLRAAVELDKLRGQVTLYEALLADFKNECRSVCDGLGELLLDADRREAA